jgi:hypothetical protein
MLMTGLSQSASHHDGEHLQLSAIFCFELFLELESNGCNSTSQVSRLRSLRFDPWLRDETRGQNRKTFAGWRPGEGSCHVLHMFSLNHPLRKGGSSFQRRADPKQNFEIKRRKSASHQGARRFYPAMRNYLTLSKVV